jgi:DNA-binding transcriptional LysR family regulator
VGNGEANTDPRAVQMVLALAQELHFGRAAARLYMSQPALSGWVKALELEIGVQLFNRSTRQVELTAAGRIFVEEARDLMAHADRVVALVRNSAPEISGHLDLGYSPCFNVGWLSSLISKMNRTAEPPVTLTLHSLESSRLSELLLKGKVQAVFSMGKRLHPELCSETLFLEEFVVAFASSCALARRSSLTFSDLAGEPVIWVRRDSEPWLYASFHETCAERHYEPLIQQEVTTFQEGLSFVRESAGIIFLPSSVRLASHDDSIVSLSLPDGGVYVESSLLYRSDNSSSELDNFKYVVSEHVIEAAAFYSLHSLIPAQQQSGD